MASHHPSEYTVAEFLQYIGLRTQRLVHPQRLGDTIGILHAPFQEGSGRPLSAQQSQPINFHPIARFSLMFLDPATWEPFSFPQQAQLHLCPLFPPSTI